MFVTDVLLLQDSGVQPDHLVTLGSPFSYMLFVCVMLCFYHVMLMSTLYCNLTCLRASIKSNFVKGSHRRRVVNLAASKNM